MKDVAYNFTGEVADKLNLKIRDLQSLARVMKLTKLVGMYIWKTEDIKKLKGLIG